MSSTCPTPRSTAIERASGLGSISCAPINPWAAAYASALLLKTEPAISDANAKRPLPRG